MLKPLAISQLILPNKGIYYWYSDYEGIQKLGISNHKEFARIVSRKVNSIDYYLIYIGIGPVSINSKSTLKDRLITHITSNISSSTFRYSLGALLNMKYYQEAQKKGKGKFHISIEDEHKIILINNPPLNIHHNKNGWYYCEIKIKRKIARSKQ